MNGADQSTLRHARAHNAQRGASRAHYAPPRKNATDSTSGAGRIGQSYDPLYSLVMARVGSSRTGRTTNGTSTATRSTSSATRASTSSSTTSTGSTGAIRIRTPSACPVRPIRLTSWRRTTRHAARACGPFAFACDMPPTRRAASRRRHYSFDCSINYYRLSSAHYSTWQQTAHRFMCVQSAPSYAEYSSSPAEYSDSSIISDDALQ